MLKATAFVGDPGPRMFPYLASVLIAVCSIALIVKPDKSGKTFFKKEEWMRALGLFAVYVVNLIIMWLFGFHISVFVTLFIITFIFSKMSAKEISTKSRIIRSLIYAVAGFLVLWLFYDVALDAQLPKGEFFDWIK